VYPIGFEDDYACPRNFMTATAAAQHQAHWSLPGKEQKKQLLVGVDVLPIMNWGFQIFCQDLA
jgi:hypothetical protein